MPSTINLPLDFDHALATMSRTHLARRRAAAPATWGVAMEVPVK